MPTFKLAFPANRLFAHALRILDDASKRYGNPFKWTLGGGTVLALRHEHRVSKDIDIFVPDPQYLGYLTPRLSDAAAEGDPDYEEGAEFVKLRYPEGEVDFVVGTFLTIPGAEAATVGGRVIELETDLEILAKKLFFRGHQFKARDFFDLAMLLDKNPGIGNELSQWSDRHRTALRSRIKLNERGLRTGFEAIDAANYRPTFEEALARVRSFLGRPSKSSKVSAKSKATRAKPEE
jgi:Nucleotidyl transferase AbiEii toxin, Type IV TA system